MGQSNDVAPHGVILPLDVVAEPGLAPRQSAPDSVTVAQVTPYSPERQRDLVRLVVASGLLLILAYLVVFATVEATSWPAHWQQTKDLLQILLPALTGIIGTVIGFYFGSTAVAAARKQTEP